MTENDLIQALINEVVGLIRRNGDDRYQVVDDFRESIRQCQTNRERKQICYEWLAIYDRRVRVLR